jgi:hypothetical protein
VNDRGRPAYLEILGLERVHLVEEPIVLNDQLVVLGLLLLNHDDDFLHLIVDLRLLALQLIHLADTPVIVGLEPLDPVLKPPLLRLQLVHLVVQLLVLALHLLHLNQ